MTDRSLVTITIKSLNPDSSYEDGWEEVLPNRDVGEDLFHQLTLVGNNFEYMFTSNEDEEEDDFE